MKKRFLAIFIVVLMLFSQITVFATDLDSNLASINPEDKLTDELKEVMNNTADDEYISISVWLYEMDDSYVYNTISEHYGVELNQDNENAFLQKQVNDKTEKFYSITSRNEMTMQSSEISIQSSEQITNEFNAIRNNSIVNDTISDNDLREFIKSGKDISEIVARSEQNAYMKEWRNARKNINSTINETFEDSLNTNKCKNIYVNSMIGYATLEVENSYILTIASSVLVKEIGLKNENVPVMKDVETNDENPSENETTEGEVLGYHMLQENFWTGYNGNGVNVGVLEVTDYMINYEYWVNYDQNNVHLSNKTGKIETRLDPEIPTNKISSTPATHATHVLAILCGNAVTSADGEVYQGVAPQANVFYTNVLPWEENIYDGLEWLVLDKNVSVINMSASFDGSYYSNVDKFVDCLVQQYRVAFVASAGNDGGYVGHPSMACNVITVGYETSLMTANGDYVLNSDSNYNEKVGVPNKPDIVAFGTNIYTLDTNREPVCTYFELDSIDVTGSSFSTPMVAGTIALMLQANPSLDRNPDKVKAILLTSANDEQIDETANSLSCISPQYLSSYFTVESIVRNKTGAGLLNTKAAVQNAVNTLTLSYTFNSTGSKLTGEYFIPAETEFKIGLVYEKTDHDLLDNVVFGTKINFEMIDITTGNVVFSSVDTTSGSYSIYDNVKIFNVTTKVSGTYVFRIYCSSLDSIDSEEDTTPPSIHQNSHTTVDVSLAITCSCLNPYTYSYNIDYSGDSTATIHSCNNTGCFYTNIGEIEYYSTLNESASFGTITYKMTYNYSYSNGKIVINDNFDVSINLSNLTQNYQIRGSGGDFYYTPTGTMEYIKYEVFITDSNGSLLGIYEIDVHIEYDNIMMKYFLTS